jgi:hypothetical protein
MSPVNDIGHDRRDPGPDTVALDHRDLADADACDVGDRVVLTGRMRPELQAELAGACAGPSD